MTKSEALPIAIEALDIAVQYINDEIRVDIQTIIDKLREINNEPEQKE